MLKKRLTDKRGYFIFTIIGLLIIVTGIVMNIFNYTSSYDIGLKYGPTENSSISGDLVIILGVIFLAGTLTFYLVERKRKAIRKLSNTS